MNVMDAIRSKRAVRQFQDKPLPDEVVETIVDAGRLSGSAKNRQPWSFIVVRDRAALEGLSTCGEFCGHLAGAAMAIALVTPDPHQRLSMPFDLGRTTQNMMLAGWELGVGSVMATIYQPNKAAEILGVPPDYVIPWCISFGYPLEDPSRRPPRKGGRRTFEDVVHWDRW
jgi:nitroreductase